MENEKSSTKGRELLLTRVLNAPIDLVWEAWTNPEHVAQWWGPNGFTNTITKMDFRVGGEWLLTMHGPDGTDYPNNMVFTEIVPHKKIVYDHVSGPKFTATVEFQAQGNKTLITWHMVFLSREQFIEVVKTYKADEGLKQNLEKLDAFLGQLSAQK